MGVETVTEVVKCSNTGVVVKTMFVKNTVLQEIEEKLDHLEDMQLSTVKKLLDEYGLNEAVLGKIGYEIEWKTLDLKNALVKKVNC